METPLEVLSRTYQVEGEFKDTAEAKSEIAGLVDSIVDQCPALKREPEYLDLLRRTGGLHAHDNRVSFGLFGFGVNVTSLRDGDLLDGGWLRFGDLMLPEFDENLVFAFDLKRPDRIVYATPGSQRDYVEHARDFMELVARVCQLADKT